MLSSLDGKLYSHCASYQLISSLLQTFFALPCNSGARTYKISLPPYATILCLISRGHRRNKIKGPLFLILVLFFFLLPHSDQWYTGIWNYTPSRKSTTPKQVASLCVSSETKTLFPAHQSLSKLLHHPGSKTRAHNPSFCFFQKKYIFKAVSKYLTAPTLGNLYWSWQR